VIERTVRSILSQTYTHIEYVVVDGNSTDHTMDIIRKLTSEHSIETKIISEPDTGIYDAMNKGLSLATGDYVWFMNAGDEIYEPTTAEKLILFFKQNADVIYGDMMRVDLSRNELGLAIHRPPKKFTWKSYKKGMTVCHQSILVSRKIAPKYDLSYQLCADIDWVIKAMKQAKIVCNSEQILSKFLIGGISKQREKQAWKERFFIMKKYYGLLETLRYHIVIGFRYFFS
jgi:glycosyltransferase involved in cell wall biosynthesis